MLNRTMISALALSMAMGLSGAAYALDDESPVKTDQDVSNPSADDAGAQFKMNDEFGKPLDRTHDGWPATPQQRGVELGAARSCQRIERGMAEHAVLLRTTVSGNEQYIGRIGQQFFVAQIFYTHPIYTAQIGVGNGQLQHLLGVAQEADAEEGRAAGGG